MATENNAYIGSPENPKTPAAIAYITFIGWIVSYFFLYKKKKTAYNSFHIRQSLLIHIISFFLKVAYSFNIPPNKTLDLVIILSGVGLFLLWLKGFWDALSGRTKPVPIIGSLAQGLFQKL